MELPDLPRSRVRKNLWKGSCCGSFPTLTAVGSSCLDAVSLYRSGSIPTNAGNITGVSGDLENPGRSPRCRLFHREGGERESVSVYVATGPWREPYRCLQSSCKTNAGDIRSGVSMKGKNMGKSEENTINRIVFDYDRNKYNNREEKM